MCACWHACVCIEVVVDKVDSARVMSSEQGVG